MMNIVEELAQARPAMIKNIMEETGCDEAQAATSVDNRSKKKLDAVLNAVADRLIEEKINAFYASGFE